MCYGPVNGWIKNERWNSFELFPYFFPRTHKSKGKREEKKTRKMLFTNIKLMNGTENKCNKTCSRQKNCVVVAERTNRSKWKIKRFLFVAGKWILLFSFPLSLSIVISNSSEHRQRTALKCGQEKAAQDYLLLKQAKKNS